MEATKVEEVVQPDELVDFCDVYLDMCLNEEAPLIFQRWSVLTALGAALERNVWISHGSNRVYPNMYTMLVGPSSSRKSSAIKSIYKRLKRAGFSKTFAGATSPEKFLEDLHVGYDTINAGGAEALLATGGGSVNSVLVVASEAITFFKTNYVSMITQMTDLWDNLDSVTTSTKKSGMALVKKPTVSVLAGTTTPQLTNMFPPEILGQGILSRMLLIYSHGSGRKFTFPEPISAEDEQSIVDAMRLIMGRRGEFTITSAGANILDKIYKGWKPIKDGRFDSYTGRRLDHVLKLSLLYAVMDLDLKNNVIDVKHIIKANTTLTYAECHMIDALGEFGSTQSSALTNSIMTVVKAHKGGIQQDQVMGAVHTEYAQPKEVLGAIVKLQTAGKIDMVTRPDDHGVMKRYFYPISSVLRQSPYVNYDLLAEYIHERKNK